MELKEALLQLDPLNDAHWTGNGDPLIGAVEGFLGSPVTRKEIVDAAPDYSRKSAGDQSSLLFKEEPENAIPEKEEAEEVILQPLSDDEADQFAQYVEENYETLGQAQMTEFVSQVSDEDAQVGIAQLDKLEAAIGEELKAIQSKIAKVRLLKKMVRLAINARQPVNSNQQAIRDYINAQQATRAEKFDALRSGLIRRDPSMIDPRSKLDQVMARKTTRGSTRPTKV